MYKCVPIRYYFYLVKKQIIVKTFYRNILNETVSDLATSNHCEHCLIAYIIMYYIPTTLVYIILVYIRHTT